MLTAFLFIPGKKRGDEAADGDPRWEEFALCTFLDAEINIQFKGCELFIVTAQKCC